MKNFLVVNSIESLSTKDGEGTRTVVFLQGCPLRCVYCHNPESQVAAGAGENVEIDELVKKMIRFKSYFGEKGGVTLSGGEPLLQAGALVEFVKKLNENQIGTAIETSGCILNDDVLNLLKLVNHVILDFKFASEADYKKYAGGSLAATVNFLNECEKLGKKIWIRIVVVPNINDKKANLKKYLKLLKGRKIEKIELLPFHTLGFDKYKKLGIVNLLENTKPMNANKCEKLQKWVDKVIIKNY